MYGQENKPMNHWTNHPRVLTQGTNDKAEIILFWTYYTKTQFSGNGSNGGKGRKKNKKRTTSKWMDSVMVAIDTLLG